jgi:hypothetical protein
MAELYKTAIVAAISTPRIGRTNTIGVRRNRLKMHRKKAQRSRAEENHLFAAEHERETYQAKEQATRSHCCCSGAEQTERAVRLNADMLARLISPLNKISGSIIAQNS